MTILVTGSAGFIGFHAANKLLEEGYEVVGVDNLNAYYDPALKAARLEHLQVHPRFHFQHAHVERGSDMLDLFQRVRPARVLHLAAQPGVRFSIDNPWAYAKANLDGFLSILEACRAGAVEHLYGLRATGLRYFTVYGPWGRPDMSIWRFTQAIETGAPISIFNHGNMTRDFTYIDDIIDGTVAALCNYPLSGKTDSSLVDSAEASSSGRKTDTLSTVFNIGGQHPEPIMRVVAILEELLGKDARCEFLPHQPGDVLQTCADLGKIRQAIGYERKVTLEEGLERWVKWFKHYSVSL